MCVFSQIQQLSTAIATLKYIYVLLFRWALSENRDDYFQRVLLFLRWVILKTDVSAMRYHDFLYRRINLFILRRICPMENAERIFCWPEILLITDWNNFISLFILKIHASLFSVMNYGNYVTKNPLLQAFVHNINTGLPTLNSVFLVKIERATRLFARDGLFVSVQSL